jgi:hypothetical protein
MQAAGDDKYRIYIQSDKYDTHPLRDFAVYKDSAYILSPNKILNNIQKCIDTTYKSTSDIARDGECITVYLSSYDMTIDCIPYIGVIDESYYLIPTS